MRKNGVERQLNIAYLASKKWNKPKLDEAKKIFDECGMERIINTTVTEKKIVMTESEFRKALSEALAQAGFDKIVTENVLLKAENEELRYRLKGLEK